MRTPQLHAPLQAPRVLAAVLLAALLAGCAAMSAAPRPVAPGAQPAGTVTRTVEQGGRFLKLVSPRVQHAEAFLGVPGTNIYALRSWIDTRSGETVHQLYVSDSYSGTERNWEAARDARGESLRFIAISQNEITCERVCSYVEEFAAALPEPLLRASPAGLAVTFTARSGATKTIAVAGDLVQQQIAAIDASRAGLAVATAAASAPAPPASPAIPAAP
jgi:hypothetical protein